MENNHCAEKIDRIYSRLAWIMLMTGGLYVVKLLAPLLPDGWQANIQTAIPWMGSLIGLMIVWALGPNLLQKIKNQQAVDQDPEGFAAHALQQALSISWGITIAGMVLFQTVSKVLFTAVISGTTYFNVMFALMTVSASITFLFLVHDGLVQPETEDWD